MALDWWGKSAPGRRYVWAPKPDITAFELAQALTTLCARAEYTAKEIIDKVDSYPAEVKRHFSEQKL